MFRHLTAGFVVALVSLLSPLQAAPAAEQTVEQVRGLKFDRPVLRKAIPRSELRAFLQKQMDADLPYTPQQYIEILRALHLVGDVEDPIGRLFSLYEAQALAFYDPRTHTYYSMDAPAGGEASLVPDEAVEIHELAHALQDQRFGIGPRLDAVRLNWDAAMAYQAVLEGEATLVMMAALYEGMGLDFNSVVRDDAFLTLLTAATSQSMGVPDGTPRYFVESMTFPYTDGLRFVIDAYRNGGWKAVDRLHEDPPRSTMEILNPETYRSGVRSKVASGAAGSGDSGPLLVTTLGAFHWKFLFGDEIASGWVSDRIEVRKGLESELTVLGESVWTSDEHASRFVTALRGKWKDEIVTGRIVADGTRVRFAHGPDGEAIKGFLRSPKGVTTPAARERKAPADADSMRSAPPQP